MNTDDFGGSSARLVDHGGSSASTESTSNVMDTDSFGTLPPDYSGGGDTMDNKDNLDDSSTNDDPGFRSNSNTSNTQQVVSDTHESRVSPYLVTRDPSLKPTGAVTNTMDKDGLWCGELWSSGKGRAMCNYDDYCGG
mgnify:CR=1 FL=1